MKIYHFLILIFVITFLDSQQTKKFIDFICEQRSGRLAQSLTSSMVFGNKLNIFGVFRR